MQYIGIRSEGGLIPYDILDSIANEEAGLGQQAKDFGSPAGRRLTDEIARAWSDAQDYWHIFQRRSASLPESETGTTLTRKWVTDLLNDLLGYELTYQPSGAVILGKNYPISHRAGVGEESPPVHVEGSRIELDRRPQGRRLSPQALVQEYLNNSEGHLWGIVTNGLLLRLLRDTSRTSRPTYLEFDLQSILDGNRFNEFALFYRVCHRSRLPKTAEDSTTCWLEKYFQLSIEQGGRVRDKLRVGVEDALTTLGTGLLRHPSNTTLRERVKSGVVPPAEFHRQLLRLVYRLLFLMVAEERRMIVPEAPDSERLQRQYDAYYGVGRLRNLAEKYVEQSKFGDLWISLQQTFALFEDGADSNPLGIPPLNGALFSTTVVKDLQETHLYNDDLLAAIKKLSLFEDHRVLQRVNYSALDVEELGSVYESLLDYQPVFDEEDKGLRFQLLEGSERKSTGSYYTRPELVRELVESALIPVMQDRLTASKDNDPDKQKQRQQDAILSMTVCDPACGSGHFLLAAARRLGRELAKVRTGEDEPTPKEFHLAVRDVIAQCVYGVDANPLAVDLCKLALWLEGHWTGKPLSFLDHRIKLGNSLIGVLDMDVLKGGVPDDAFTAVAGDEKKVASDFKKKNREERKGQPRLPFDGADHVHQYATESEVLVSIAENTPADVRRKKEAYEKTRQKPDWWHDWVSANLWTAAFFVPLTKFDDPAVPTTEKLAAHIRGGHVDGVMEGSALGLAQQLKFFHWPLEFPDVFQRGGFDVVLGNPPWDMIQPEEVKFFAAVGAKDISRLQGSKRKKAIKELDSKNPGLAKRWRDYQHEIDSQCKFIRSGGRFDLTAVGKLNTYSLFAELAANVVSKTGRAGIIVQSGIATDEGNKDFFASLISKERLVSLFDFVNLEGFFPGIHRTHPHFCALTIAATRYGKPVQFAFYMTRTNQLLDKERRFTLDSADFTLLNPNTLTCPVFRTRADAALTRSIYRRVPVLVRGKNNPWNLEFRQGLFNTTSDSGLFLTEPRNGYLRLYESKMFHQFDHRWATMQDGVAGDLSLDQKRDALCTVTPRYWVPTKDVELRAKLRAPRWLLAFRKLTNATNERTSIVAVLPFSGIADSAVTVVGWKNDATFTAAFLANFNSIVLDYVVRQKIGGTNLNPFIIEQLPVLPPSAYAEDDLSFIQERVGELVYTATDMEGFARDLGLNSKPFQWSDERRAQLRAELDAYYAHLYGITRDDLRYILDPKDVFGDDFPSETFRVLKEREVQELGEYRTRRLVLDAFDQLAMSARFRGEISNRVSVLQSSRESATVTAS